MSGYIRNLQQKVQRLLTQFPVVAIIGARQVGKTTLAKQIGDNWDYFDLENPDHFDRISSDPSFFFKEHPQYLILDEAQEYPDLFRVLRGVVDDNRDLKGRFLITGSSSMALLDQITESLAGRIAIVELGTLKSNEYYKLPLSPIFQLIAANPAELLHHTMAPVMTRDQVQELWLNGGYPDPLKSKDPQYYADWMQEYHFNYVQRDISRLFPKLNRTNYRRFTQSLAHLSSTILNKRDIARGLEINESTVRDYIEIADATFLWRIINSFERSSLKSVTKLPKGHYRDTGLLHFLLKITSTDTLMDHPIRGKSFEAFCTEEILKGLAATSFTNWSYHYYRTRNGAEIDLVLDTPNGLIPIEIKSGSSVKANQLRSIKAFMGDYNCPLGLIVNQGDQIEKYGDRLVQVPIQYL